MSAIEVTRGPLAVAGWSFGGLVAYELARVLRGRGREVEHLFLVGGTFARLPAALGSRCRRPWQPKDVT